MEFWFSLVLSLGLIPGSLGVHEGVGADFTVEWPEAIGGGLFDVPVADADAHVTVEADVPAGDPPDREPSAA